MIKDLIIILLVATLIIPSRCTSRDITIESQSVNTYDYAVKMNNWDTTVLTLNQQYNVEGVSFYLDAYKPGDRIYNEMYDNRELSRIVFSDSVGFVGTKLNSLDPEFDYSPDTDIITQPSLLLENDSEKYLLISCVDDDSEGTIVYKLKNGKAVWVSSSIGYIIGFDQNNFTLQFRLHSYNILNNDVFVTYQVEFSNDELKNNEFSYSFVNANDIEVVKPINAFAYDTQKQLYYKHNIVAGEIISFTRTNFVDKLWYSTDTGYIGYIEISVKDYINNEVLSSIYIDDEKIVNYLMN